MTRINRRAFGVGLLAGATAAQSETGGRAVWSPETIFWQRIEKDGTKYAVLDGDRDAPGSPFSYAFWMPGKVWVKAHHHSQQAHVFVARGDIKIGYGDKLDKTKTTTLSAGQFFIVRAREAHFEGSDGECLIIGTALGGWKTTNLE